MVPVLLLPPLPLALRLVQLPLRLQLDLLLLLEQLRPLDHLQLAALLEKFAMTFLDKNVVELLKLVSKDITLEFAVTLANLVAVETMDLLLAVVFAGINNTFYANLRTKKFNSKMLWKY
jgi:hypothetical protein